MKIDITKWLVVILFVLSLVFNAGNFFTSSKIAINHLEHLSAEIKSDFKDLNERINRIDSRLSKIEGKLG